MTLKELRDKIDAIIEKTPSWASASCKIPNWKNAVTKRDFNIDAERYKLVKYGPK